MVSSNGRAPDVGPALDIGHELPQGPDHGPGSRGDDLPGHSEGPKPPQPDDDDDEIPR
jgi:hypothetical protein